MRNENNVIKDRNAALEGYAKEVMLQEEGVDHD